MNFKFFYEENRKKRKTKRQGIYSNTEAYYVFVNTKSKSFGSWNLEQEQRMANTAIEIEPCMCSGATGEMTGVKGRGLTTRLEQLLIIGQLHHRKHFYNHPVNINVGLMVKGEITILAW